MNTRSGRLLVFKGRGSLMEPKKALIFFFGRVTVLMLCLVKYLHNTIRYWAAKRDDCNTFNRVLFFLHSYSLIIFIQYTLLRVNSCCQKVLWRTDNSSCRCSLFSLSKVLGELLEVILVETHDKEMTTIAKKWTHEFQLFFLYHEIGPSNNAYE